MIRKLVIAALLAMLVGTGAAAQDVSSRYQGQVIGTRGLPLANQNVAVCTQPADTSTQPCTPRPTLGTSTTTTTGGANPLTTDVNGNFFFYAPPGKYTIQVYGPQVGTPFVQPDTLIQFGTTSNTVFTGNNTHSGTETFNSLVNGNAIISMTPQISSAVAGPGSPITITDLNANKLFSFAPDVDGNLYYAGQFVHEVKSVNGTDLNLRSGAATKAGGAGLEDIHLITDGALFWDIKSGIRIRPTATSSGTAVSFQDKSSNVLFYLTNDTATSNLALNLQRGLGLFSASADTTNIAGNLFYRSDLARPRYFDSAWHSLVGADTTDTLTNKTLTSPAMTGTPTVNGIPIAGGFTAVNITPVTVSANVATDQNLMAVTVTAGALNSLNRTLLVQLAGVYSTPAASTSVVTVKLKLCTVSGCGSGTVLTLANISSSALGGIQATNDPFNLNFNISTQTAGASAAFEAHGNLTIDISALSTAAEGVFADTNTATIGTIDSTAQLFLQTTIAFSNASGSNTATQRQMIADTVD
jgi:hypothetical protein